MCHSPNSLPAIPPIAGAAVDSEDLTLVSADGTEFAAFFAHGGRPGQPSVIILPDVRGLHRFYEELALRFAERGVDAIAIDYFGRTAGVGKRDDDFPFMEHVQQTRVEAIAADVRAACTHLRQQPQGQERAVFSMGFCFGGGQSWLQAANGHGLSGVIGFYGSPTRAGRDGSPAPIERVREFRCPVLALMGGADQGIPASDVEQYTQALTQAGVVHEAQIYPDTPHSFFDRSFAEHADAAADAWNRVQQFIATNSARSVGAT